MTTTLTALPATHRDHLLSLAADVRFPAARRLFEEGAVADRFWILRTGSVTLDARLPHRRNAEIATLQPGDLVGLSWLFPPYAWELGAETLSPVRAHAFDAARVRDACTADPAFGYAISQWVGAILAGRLQATRSRLLELYESAVHA